MFLFCRPFLKACPGGDRVAACGCRVVMTDLPGVDSWMPEGLCAQGFVERVPSPQLIKADTPVADDLPRFVEELAEARTGSRQKPWNADGRRCRLPAGAASGKGCLKKRRGTGNWQDDKGPTSVVGFALQYPLGIAPPFSPPSTDPPSSRSTLPYEGRIARMKRTVFTTHPRCRCRPAGYGPTMACFSASLRSPPAARAGTVAGFDETEHGSRWTPLPARPPGPSFRSAATRPGCGGVTVVKTRPAGPERPTRAAIEEKLRTTPSPEALRWATRLEHQRLALSVVSCSRSHCSRV